LALLTDFEPHVAVLDIGLPRMDGYELARRIRAERADVYLIAVSGYGQAEDRQRSREAGFDEYFVKPVDPEHLLALIAKLN
jgi:DNA-binding response OmpR family regulator